MYESQLFANFAVAKNEERLLLACREVNCRCRKYESHYLLRCRDTIDCH